MVLAQAPGEYGVDPRTSSICRGIRDWYTRFWRRSERSRWVSRRDTTRASADGELRGTATRRRRRRFFVARLSRSVLSVSSDTRLTLDIEAALRDVAQRVQPRCSSRKN